MRWERVLASRKARGAAEGRRTAARRAGVVGPGRRWGHTCNAVKGGRELYVFGGYGEDNCQTNDVHVFDTVNQTWSKPVVRGAPPLPRDSHTCTTVGERLFMFGGTDGVNPLKDLYVLDTSNNTWILPITHGKGPDAREGHGAALVGNKLFIFGGCGKSKSNSEEVYYDDLYILDTEKLVWEVGVTAGTPPSARDSHTCTSFGSKLIVLGGEDASDCYLSDVYVLDTESMVWEELNTSGQMLAPRAGHSTVALGRNLFVFGGFANRKNLYDDLHVLNIDTGIWNKVTSVSQGPSARFSAAGDCVDPQSGTLVLSGGCNRDLQALNDMYYLYTDIQAGNGGINGKREKLSFRKELKGKCQEGAYENDHNVHIGMTSESTRTGRSLHNSNATEKRTFEAMVVDVTRDGYTIETTIDGQRLRGILISSNPNFNYGRHLRINKNMNKKRMRMDNDARSMVEHRRRLGTGNATPPAIQRATPPAILSATPLTIRSPHEGVIDQVDQAPTKELTTAPSHNRTPSRNVMTSVPADVAVQPDGGSFNYLPSDAHHNGIPDSEKH